MSTQLKLHKGIKLFNSGKYHEAHEEFEFCWNQSLDEKEKKYFQGLVQCAAALHLLRKGNAFGANKVWNKAIDNLQGAPAQFQGIKISRLKLDLKMIFESCIDGRTSFKEPKINLN